jgi:hypothetical protein
MTGRERVERALADVGILLVQGQGPVPSIADLLAGAPVTTRGFSWDYVPAWEARDDLLHRDDVALCKLVGGRATLVSARWWAPVHALALASRAAIVARSGDAAALLHAIERAPGTPGATLRASFPRFPKLKADLESWLAIVAEEQDSPTHTHDAAWFPWSSGRIARGAGPWNGTTEDALAIVIDVARDLPVARLLAR